MQKYLRLWCWLVDEELIGSQEGHDLRPALPWHLSHAARRAHPETDLPQVPKGNARGFN